jgi:hypothetical protein
MQVTGMSKTSHIKYLNKLSLENNEEEEKNIYKEIEEEKKKNYKALRERKKEEMDLLLKYYPTIVKCDTGIEDER